MPHRSAFTTGGINTEADTLFYNGVEKVKSLIMNFTEQIEESYSCCGFCKPYFRLVVSDFIKLYLQFGKNNSAIRNTFKLIGKSNINLILQHATVKDNICVPTVLNLLCDSARRYNPVAYKISAMTAMLV